MSGQVVRNFQSGAIVMESSTLFFGGSFSLMFVSLPLVPYNDLKASI